MHTRRRFLQLALAALLAAPGANRAVEGRGAAPAQPSPAGRQLWIPLVRNTAPPVDDAPILGPPSGTYAQAVEWLTPRTNSYTPSEIQLLVDLYRRTAEPVELDWFLAIAQMVHETGSLTSWWCQRPRRNPAGIGVTGAVRQGTPETPPGKNWAWDDRSNVWREGVSFPTWTNDAVPAHVGRLLAYALRDDQAGESQRALIAKALSYRPLRPDYRGIAPTIVGLNGRWAVPGTQYGQTIVQLARRMRGQT